jgi:glycosyltransferase involved in cell wall biosynthesis
MDPRKDLAPALQAAGIPVISVSVPGPLKTIRMVRKLRQLIRAGSYDLIHTTNAEAGVVGGLAARLAGVPVVTTLNGTAYDATWLVDNPHLNRVKLKYMKTSRWAALRFLSDHSIAVSQYVKDDFHRALGVQPSRMDVVLRGVSDSFFDADHAQVARAREELLPGSPFPVLVNVARLVPAKGHRYLISAMPEVLKRYPSARLLLVGDGPMGPDLRNMVRKLGLTACVIFAGVRRDIRAVLETADVFVLPSLREGCPGALIEAMAAGKPCVASDCGPMPELIEHEVSGLLAQPQSVEAIAQAVVRIASDAQLRDRLGVAARERAMANFRIEESVRTTEDVFESVIARRTGNRTLRVPSAPVHTETARFTGSDGSASRNDH